MGVYNVHGGHNRIVPGAGHYLDEVTEDRKITAGVIALLQASGHTAYNCTDDVGKTVGANLANIVAKCNAAYCRSGYFHSPECGEGRSGRRKDKRCGSVRIQYQL